MSISLSSTVNEKSTAVITVTFFDEDDASVIPNSITWTFTQIDGTVINSRLDVPVAVPVASIDIVLSGDDFEVFTDDDLIRILTIETLYDSSAGTDLPMNEEARFRLNDLVNIS